MLGAHRILSLWLVSLLPGTARGFRVSPRAPRAGMHGSGGPAGDGLGWGYGQEGELGGGGPGISGCTPLAGSLQSAGSSLASCPGRVGRAGRGARPSR